MIDDIGGHMSIQPVMILISFWVGSIIFFSAIIAPTIFKSVDEKNAGYFLRAFFPKYYNFGLILGLSALIIMMFAGLTGIFSFLSLIALIGMTVLTGVSKILIPIINKAKDLGEEGKSMFKKMQWRSVLLNIFTLILGLGFL